MTEAPDGNQSTTLPGKETLSQLVARILDQLSVSAWLPAGVLVFIILVVGSLRATQGDVGDALGKLGDLSASSLVLLFIAVILTTVITQAFQFEAIRLLEGYWGPGRARTAIAGRRCRRHLTKRNRLWKRMNAINDHAFRSSMCAMLDRRGISTETIDLVRRLHHGEVKRDELSESQREQVRRHAWEKYAPISDRRQVDSLAAAARRAYPDTDLAIRPTRLGNTLRAYEDPVEAEIGAPIERFVQRVFHKLPPATQVNHDHVRARLDLYCSLVVVFVLGGAIAVAVLATVDAVEAVIAGAVAPVLAWLSYRAAVTSARHYGTMLQTIADLVGDATGDAAAAN